MDFAILFKDIRRHEKLTQNEFANRLNISRSAIAQIESSKNNPSRDLMLNILEKTNLPIDLKQKLEKSIGIKEGRVTEIKGTVFNADQLDDNKKEALELWNNLLTNRDILLSLCFALKEIKNADFSNEEIEKLNVVNEVTEYLFKILIPYDNIDYVSINNELLRKIHRILEESNKYIKEYTFKLSEIYKNRLRVFDDLKEYKNYKDWADDC